MLLRQMASPDAVDLRVRELTMSKVAGESIGIARMEDGEQIVFQPGRPLSMLVDRDLLARAATVLFPGRPVDETVLLPNGDAYYYGTLHRQVRLPVLRIQFTDPAASWVYVDARSGVVQEVLTRERRLYRWLYQGLHSWDWPFLLAHNAWRRVAMCTIGAVGLVLAVTGAALGVSRLLQALGFLGHRPPGRR